MNNLRLKKVVDKKKITLIIAIVFIILVSIFFIIKMKGTHSVESDDVFNNQIVDGLSFENAKVSKNNGETTFNVEVYNETDVIYDFKNITIKIITVEGQEYNLLGSIDKEIKVDEGKYISTKIDDEIGDIKEIEYIINK